MLAYQLLADDPKAARSGAAEPPVLCIIYTISCLAVVFVMKQLQLSSCVLPLAALQMTSQCRGDYFQGLHEAMQQSFPGEAVHLVGKALPALLHPWGYEITPFYNPAYFLHNAGAVKAFLSYGACAFGELPGEILNKIDAFLDPIDGDKLDALSLETCCKL